MILVGGGAGFIGSNFVLDWLATEGEPVLNLDLLTYAGNRDNLAALEGDARHVFVQGDIGDRALVGALLAQYRPRALVQFAAESHVDRSIQGAGAFIDTNIGATFRLLETVRAWWSGLPDGERAGFRFVQVSTDEVYGSLAPDAPAFTEDHPFRPNSPYAASKAAADHLVRAWHHTYGLPVLTTHCSNNYGPFQFPEKLIPLMLCRALDGAPLPVYGDGAQVRDWLHVADHGAALRRVLAAGQAGRAYNIGGQAERSNLAVVQAICDLLDAWHPRADGVPYATQIAHVADRPGHDRRYAVDTGRIARELGWRPAITFDDGLARTVRWYLDHPQWLARVRDGSYRAWLRTQYGA